jgi:membrane protease subunit (stomatin/prohibitin family)
MAAGMAVGQTMAKAFNPSAVAQSVLGGGTAAPTPPVASDDPTSRLEKLKGLLDKGLISQADYDTAKAEILKKLMG